MFCSSWHVELMLLVELMRRAPRTSSIPLSEMLKIARLVGNSDGEDRITYLVKFPEILSAPTIVLIVSKSRVLSAALSNT